jgi:hypothetical protein
MTGDPNDVDRRHARRLPSAEHRISAVRIRPGLAATVIDLSASGALLETTHRLLPGNTVEVHMERGASRCCVRARIDRCAVATLRAGTIFYRGAVMFDRHLPWFVAPDGYPIPTADQRAGRADRADATRPVV